MMTSRSGRRRLLTVARLLVCPVLAACGDMTGPTSALVDPASSAEAEAGLTGAYESRQVMLTASGAELYLVGVYFGTATPGSPRDYLLQLGVRRADGGSQLVLVQGAYQLAGDSIHFAGNSLRRGRVEPEGLSAEVLVDGAWTPVHLVRIATP